MSTKVLIIEDEKPAQEHLKRLICSIDENIIILDVLDSIEASIIWLSKYEADLIFMDIHLTDGTSFHIFEKVNVKCPIVFTTAYDEFALRAFKVNSIDYLLKPIDIEDVRNSLEKYNRLQSVQDKNNLASLIQAFHSKKEKYQDRFLVHRGERLMSIDVSQIAYFEGEDRYVYLIKNDGSRYIIDYRLSDLEHLLDPDKWFRVNRSFICHIECITSIVQVSKSRIKLELLPKAKREIIISSENSQTFKDWLGR